MCVCVLTTVAQKYNRCAQRLVGIQTFVSGTFSLDSIPGHTLFWRIGSPLDNSPSCQPRIVGHGLLVSVVCDNCLVFFLSPYVYISAVDDDEESTVWQLARMIT